MRHRAILAIATVLGLAGALVPAASAAPLGAKAPAPSAASIVEPVDLVTRCWETPSGRRRCKTFYVNPAKLNNPDRYPYGSTEWWRAMDRSGRGGYLR